MGKLRWVLAGIAGLGLFSAGYLVGRQNVGQSTGGSESSTWPAHRTNRQDPEFLPERTRTRPTQKPADGASPSYRKIVEMVSKGDFEIPRVGINHDTFLPRDKVAEFFGLSGEQLAEMKRLGRERLQEMRNREQSLAKIQEVSESGIEFDLPADPEFAATQAAEFTEDLRRTFGPDVAAMLQPSIIYAYSRGNGPSHIRYSFTRQDAPAKSPDLPEEAGVTQAGIYTFRTYINMPEDGKPLRDVRGVPLLDSISSTGTWNNTDTRQKTYPPRYHYLWEREMKRR